MPGWWVSCVSGYFHWLGRQWHSGHNSNSTVWKFSACRFNRVDACQCRCGSTNNSSQVRNNHILWLLRLLRSSVIRCRCNSGHLNSTIKLYQCLWRLIVVWEWRTCRGNCITQTTLEVVGHGGKSSRFDWSVEQHRNVHDGSWGRSDGHFEVKFEVFGLKVSKINMWK